MARKAKKQISFTTAKTGTRWTIKPVAGSRYNIEFIDLSGDVTVTTMPNNEYHNKASAVRALQGIADMFISNGNMVTWEEEGK